MACSIEPASVRLPPPTKKMSSALWIVFSRWAMMTCVVVAGRRSEYLFQQLFGDRVDIGGGFVEDQDFRLAQHRAQEGDQLLLTQREASPRRR